MAFQGAIFDVDGVLVDSPHELAWRESLRRLLEEWRAVRDPDQLDAEHFTSAVYQRLMAGKPRLAERPRGPSSTSASPMWRPGPSGTPPRSKEQVVKAHRGRPVLALPRRTSRVHPGRQGGRDPGRGGVVVQNAKLFLTRIRLDTFAAEQRLDYASSAPA